MRVTKKKLHSGNKIIEICVESEDDILQLAENGIVESNNHYVNKYNVFERNLQKVCFYGFKNKDCKNSRISNVIEFVRYILYKSGKTQCFSR